jgi:putative inorganic carbon (HCO3(-)) transporter
MDLAFFLLLNAVLLIRPEELFPELEGVRLYLIVIVLCLLTTAPRVLAQLTPASLSRRPITVCVLGLLGSMALSFLARGRLWPIQEYVPEFAKVVLYYLLLLAVIDTPGRLRLFLGWLVLLVGVLAALAVLQYHGSIDVPAFAPLERKDIDPQTGGEITYLQLRGNGTFNDPNDLCLILMAGSICTIYRAVTAANWPATFLWLSPLGLFGYAVMLTRSRGGLLCFGAAVVAFLFARYGGRRAIPLAAVSLPILLTVFAGRQTDFDLGAGDTAQQRIQFWTEGLSLLLRGNWGPQAIITGAGAGEYEEEMGHVAHNSFVQAYVELGLIGGGLFLGMFALSGWGLHRVRAEPNLGTEPGMAEMRPCLLAIIVGYAVGNYSLSRNYVIPTYLVVGLAAAYLAMAVPAAASWFRADWKLARSLAVLAVAGLVFLKVFTQVFVRY